LDKKNVKAYLRRGIAREAVLNHQEALQGAIIKLKNKSLSISLTLEERILKLS
jgi:hypothetical protein